MPSKFAKRCILCQHDYKYCGSCSKYANYPRWMESFDNDNCHTIFNLIMDYRTGTKTPAECKKVMEACDLSYRDKFSEGMNAFITAILSVNAEPEATEKPEVTEKPGMAEEEAETEVKVEGKPEEAPAEKVNKPYDYKKFSSNKKRK